MQQGLLQALRSTIAPQHLELRAGLPVPVWQVIGDAGKALQVLIVPAYNSGQEDEDILDRKELLTLQATAALLNRNSLAPGSGASLLENLDENAHKHAFEVSEDLKYAIREAIEVLGNEAVRQLRQQAVEARRGFFSGKDELDPEQLSLECLRLVYRLLFMCYIEARPELGYVPIRTSEVYLKGYSLASLRDLELTPLHTPQARDGLYFDHTLRRLFSLVSTGCAPAGPAESDAPARRDLPLPAARPGHGQLH